MKHNVKRVLSLVMVFAIFLSLAMPSALAASTNYNVSYSPVNCNASAGKMPPSASKVNTNDTIYFNFQVDTSQKIKSVEIYLQPVGKSKFQRQATDTARNYMRYTYFKYNTGNQAGNLKYYFKVTFSNRSVKYYPNQSGNTISVKAVASGSWQWPVKDLDVSQYFGDYNSEKAAVKRPYHAGMDLTDSTSDSDNPPIYAASAGTVKYKGYDNANGNHVILRHSMNGQTVYSLYSHLLNTSGCPNVGKKVDKGQRIGFMGDTGYSNGTHLHFAIFTGRESNSPWGYTDKKSTIKMNFDGLTFYNPTLVINNNRLP